jgi:hypothetical protein
MSMASMKYVSGMMDGLALPYAFMRWTKKEIPDVYFVGEYNEIPSTTREENGRQDVTVILRGFTRGEWLLLEEAKEKIEKSCAKTVILSDGTGLAVFYDSAMPVPTGDADLKSIKINLTIQEWRVN